MFTLQHNPYTLYRDTSGLRRTEIFLWSLYADVYFSSFLHGKRGFPEIKQTLERKTGLLHCFFLNGLCLA